VHNQKYSLASMGASFYAQFSAFNYAMLGKQALSLMSNSGKLITRLFKAKYFLKCDFLDSKYWS
jgi:hypothetical protein